MASLFWPNATVSAPHVKAHTIMSKNVIGSIKKKSGGLEHSDECPKRISHSQVSDLVFKREYWFSGEICRPKRSQKSPKMNTCDAK